MGRACLSDSISCFMLQTSGENYTHHSPLSPPYHHPSHRSLHRQQSAILAAIQICLGAGARRTHRATNLKELVRKEAGSNCNGAKVRVTVLNRGDDGYQHDVYGDSITIERSISLRGGYNGYKLLDEHGTEKSRNKKDLDAMLDQLNIQVENPVAVLDQEEAKKFLCGKPEDKYNFFTKATELERMDRAYANLSDNIADMDTAHGRIEETLEPKKQLVKKLKHEYDQFKDLDKLEAEVGELRVSAVWAKRNEMQAKADEAQEVGQRRLGFLFLSNFDSFTHISLTTHFISSILHSTLLLATM